MNYFAHGHRYVDRPYLLVGTAIPDLLSVSDRRVRMRTRNVAPFCEDDDPIQAEIASGVLQHLHDDQWFHGTRGFAEVTAEIGRAYRDVLDSDDDFRPGFLGHITTELILDGVLIEDDPSLLDAYYDAFLQVNPIRVQSAVNRMARDSAENLAQFVPLFVREEFLRDYREPRRMLFRLNQVMRRIKLKQLPDSVEEVIAAGWTIVADRVTDLLPPDKFCPSTPNEGLHR